MPSLAPSCLTSKNAPPFRPLALIMVAAIALLSCEQGPGTQGPQGEQGPPGSPGAQGPTGNPGAALNWADVLFESGISDAIYSVGVTLTAGSKRYNYVLGSAFAAHYINGVWTNAHVAIRVRDEADQVPEWADTVTPFVAKSGTFIGGVNTHRPTRYDVHPYYDGSTASPDVAFILIDDDLPNLAEILPRRFVTRLQVGQPIATIGFPGETTSAYTRYARATFKDGTISALQPYLLSTQESPEKNRILQHNLDTTGGTSGSAIFDSSGWVVAVNHAAAGKWVMGEDGDPVIIRTGAIGSGIRIDEVWTMIDIFEQQRSATGSHATRLAPAKNRHHLTSYQAFPKNWNGETTIDGIPTVRPRP